MGKLEDLFYISVSSHKMVAEIHCKEFYKNTDVQLNYPLIIQFLKDNNIVYGVKRKTIELLMTNISSDQFPVVIANGKNPQDGIDGKVVYEQDYNKTDIVRGEDWDFREVMRIPTVKKGDKLATILPPTESQKGKNVYGNVLNGRSGKPALLRAGKGVVFSEDDQSFYAEVEGQVSVADRVIQIHPVFEVDGTLSLEVGNIDFIGSIVINGDVPTGYTVKAAGDIKIRGIVEASTVIAGGSIYISEGLSGLKTGFLKADENIHIGYINQGTVEAGHSIHVENSIIHSNCSASTEIFCQNGNIIGGSISAGNLIEAGDLGNRLSTKTMVTLDLNKKLDDEQKQLIAEKKELTETLKKVKTLGDMLKRDDKQHDPKMRIATLRQKHSFKQISEKINQINLQLQKKDANLTHKEASLIVRKTLYPNVTVSFGKYERKINIKRQNIKMKLDQNDIVIREIKE